MKKYIFIIVIFTLVLTGCKSNKSNTSNNMSGFVDNVAQIKKINCEAIEKYSIVDSYYLDYSNPFYLVLLSNGMVYSITNELYSNDQQCKTISDDIKFISLGYHLSNDDGYYLISEDNKYYLYENGNIKLNDSNYYLDLENKIPSSLFNNKDISKISIMKLNEEQQKKYKDSQKDDGHKVLITTYKKYMYIKDGSIYEGFVKRKYYKYYWENSRGEEISDELVEEKMLYSKDEYGYITDYREMEWLNNNSIIISDKGIFKYSDIETEECKKYADIKCDKKFIKIDKMDKYINDIKYMNIYYVVTNDNSFIKFSDFLDSLMN